MENLHFILGYLATIRSAVDQMAQDHPDKFAVYAASIGCANGLSEACEVLGYTTPDAFVTDYHNAVETLINHLKALGYPMPDTDEDLAIEERIDWDLVEGEHPVLDPEIALPANEVVERWYKGHILRIAIDFFRQRSRSSIQKLWRQFPDRRVEIEMAFEQVYTEGTFGAAQRHIVVGLADAQTVQIKLERLLDAGGPGAAASMTASQNPEAKDTHTPRPYTRAAAAVVATLASEQAEAAKQPAQPTLGNRLLEYLFSGIFGRFTIGAVPALIAVGLAGFLMEQTFKPSDAQQVAISSFENNWGQDLLSAQGMFELNKEVLKGPHPGAPKPSPEQPVPVQVAESEPERDFTPPKRQTQNRTRIPTLQRDLDISRPSIGQQTIPDVSGPGRENSAGNSNYFGDRPDVKIVPREVASDFNIPASPGAIPQSIQPPSASARPKSEPAQSDEYQLVGNISFSDFRTSGSLTVELPNLTSIERRLSKAGSQNRTLEGAQIHLDKNYARVDFPDGVKFTIIFQAGALKNIEIHKRTSRQINTEQQGLRGIRFLSQALPRLLRGQ